jgi:hypothetical protein
VNVSDWVMLSVGIGQIVVLGASGIFIGLQVRYAKLAQQTLVQLERAKKSSEYVSRWNNPQMDQVRHQVVEAIRTMKIEEQHHVVLTYLNFFFEMALALDLQLADDQLCMAYFRGPLHRFWSDVEPYLLKSNNTRYDRVKKLDSRWQAIDPIT